MLIANMATYPARESILESTVETLVDQVDILNLCLNEFSEIPSWCGKYSNLNPVIPEKDWKDVGKFIFEANPDDDVFLVDDDIIYPGDYVSSYLRARAIIGLESLVIGAHAIIYSDFFDGMAHSRNVRSFRLREEKFRLVNQLGTGTVLVKGCDLPSLKYMEGSERFVDVRFSKYQYERNIPLISIPRDSGWMQDKDVDGGIFEDFTAVWPSKVIAEAMDIAGYSKLNIEFLNKRKEVNISFFQD